MTSRGLLAIAAGAALAACSGARSSVSVPDDVVTIRSALTTVLVTAGVQTELFADQKVATDCHRDYKVLVTEQCLKDIVDDAMGPGVAEYRPESWCL